MKEDVVLDEIKKDLMFIDEKNYQQIKKNMRKKNDYFNIEEIQKMEKFLA